MFKTIFNNEKNTKFIIILTNFFMKKLLNRKIFSIGSNKETICKNRILMKFYT
ncbi:hypothetical protein HMPREF3156_00953 [Neisseria sp. HMSC06F02]|nr:hypothetical protein HMPREF3156_00953 [Neisseria sp. HMSC06F02]